MQNHIKLLKNLSLGIKQLEWEDDQLPSTNAKVKDTRNFLDLHAPHQ
jgi:hypothetical protein